MFLSETSRYFTLKHALNVLYPSKHLAPVRKNPNLFRRSGMLGLVRSHQSAGTNLDFFSPVREKKSGNFGCFAYFAVCAERVRQTIVVCIVIHVFIVFCFVCFCVCVVKHLQTSCHLSGNVSCSSPFVPFLRNNSHVRA